MTASPRGRFLSPSPLTLVCLTNDSKPSGVLSSPFFSSGACKLQLASISSFLPNNELIFLGLWWYPIHWHRIHYILSWYHGWSHGICYFVLLHKVIGIRRWMNTLTNCRRGNLKITPTIHMTVDTTCESLLCISICVGDISFEGQTLWLQIWPVWAILAVLVLSVALSVIKQKHFELNLKVQFGKRLF